MRKIKIVLLFAFILSMQGCLAQYTPVNVNISQEIVNVEGVHFYRHRVEKRQTLFSISKAYGVDTQTIINDNPNLSEGLKEGSYIIIRKSTPLEKEKSTPSFRVQIEHRVKWHESLADIAKKYDVLEEEIMVANNLSSKKVTSRQILKIPVKGDIDLSKYQKTEVITSEIDRTTEEISNVEHKETKENNQRRESIFFGKKSTFNAALLLPLGGSQDSLIVSENIANFFDFYQGFLLGLNEVKNSYPGIELNIDIIDTDLYSGSNQLANSINLNNKDIIIGPIYYYQIEPIVQRAKQNNIPVISPIDPNALVFADYYSNFYNSTSPGYYQQERLISVIPKSDPILVVYETGTQNSTLVSTTKELLSQRGIVFKELSYDILSGRTILPQFIQSMMPEGKNRVIVASDSEAFVSDVLRNLNLLYTRNGIDMQLYGTHRWRFFETVDINLYHTLNLTIALQYFIDYTDFNVKRFIQNYRNIYNTEPSPFSFQAYDIANYFISALINSNDLSFFKGRGVRHLQSDYNFIRKEMEGYVNKGVRVITYRPDFSIELLPIL